MGHVRADVILSWRRSLRVRALVDTRATYSVVLEKLAKELGLPSPAKGLRVTPADGSVVVLPQTTVQIRVDGREAGAAALLAPGGEVLLGVEALESLGLSVEPRRRRLVPSRPWEVRPGGYRKIRAM